MIVRKTNVALIALLLAGCGGGGSDEQAVSANPPAASPAPVGSTPAPVVAAPVPVQPPVATPPVGSPPTTTPAPVVTPAPPEIRTVDGSEIIRAMYNGVPISEEIPENANPGPGGITSWHYSHTRRTYPEQGESFALNAGGSTTGFGISTGLPFQGGMYPSFALRRMSLDSRWSADSLTVANANNVVFPAVYVPINGTIRLDQVLQEWKNGDWYVRLLPQSIDGRPDVFRLCWLTFLPDLGATDGFFPQFDVAPGPPINRLSCAEHRRSDGKDVGGYIVDDVVGAVTTYRGEW